MPPEERRAALVAATLPLVAQYGTKVTTRQIAEAAGVAEGTIFRVFPDKEALVQAAVEAALDPVPVLAELAGVDTTLPLRERMAVVVEILQRRLVSVFSVLTALRMHKPPEDLDAHRRATQPKNELINAAVIRIFEPDRDQLLHPVGQVARMLRLLTFAASHPLITEGNPLTAAEITSVLLDGVCRHHPDVSHPGEHPC